MTDKNSKLLLQFMVEELKEDMNKQRIRIDKMEEFKNTFIDYVEKNKLLFRENTENEETEVNADILNSILNINNDIDASFKILIESYAKIGSTSSTLEKAYKENNSEVKPKGGKAPVPVGKGLF